MAREVKIRVKADAKQAKKELSSLDKAAQKAMNDMAKEAKSNASSMISSFKSVALAIGTAVTAMKTLQVAYDATVIGNKLQIQQQAFSNLARSHGLDSNRIISDLKRISNQTIDTATLTEKAGTAMLLGIPADKLDDLMRIARASMKVTGQTATEAFSDISLAVGRQSKMILDNLGIVMRLEDAYEHYAAQLGKAVKDLTEAEKKQAFLNETLIKGEEFIKRIGDTTGNEFEAISQFTTNLKDALNELYILIANDLNPILETLNKNAHINVESIYNMSKIIITTSALLLVFTNLWGRLIKNLKDVAMIAKLEVFTGMEKLKIAVKGVSIGIVGALSSITGMTIALGALAAALYYLVIKTESSEKMLERHRKELGLSKEAVYGYKRAVDDAVTSLKKFKFEQLRADIAKLEGQIASGGIAYTVEDAGTGSEEVIQNLRRRDLARLKNMLSMAETGLDWDEVSPEEKSKQAKIEAAQAAKTTKSTKEQEETEKRINALIQERIDYKNQVFKMTKEIQKIRHDAAVGDEKAAVEEALRISETTRDAIKRIKEDTDTSVLEEFFSVSPEQEKQLAKAMESITAEAEQMKAIWADVGDVMVSDISYAFADWVTGAQTAKEAFADMAQDMAGWLVQLAAKMIMINAIKTMFPGVGSFLSFDKGGITPDVPGAATGAVFSGPSSGYPVMMHGNEAVVPLPDGKSIPVEMKGSGGMVNNININVQPNKGDNKEAKQYGNVIGRMVKTEVEKIIVNNKRSGGLLNRQQQGVY